MDSREKIWRELEASAGPITGLRVTSSPVFEPGLLTLGQLTVLTGLHSAGKSYALSLVHEGLPGWQARWDIPPRGPERIVALTGEYELILANGGSERLSLPSSEKYGYHRPVSTRSLTGTSVDTHTVISDLSMVEGNLFVPDPIGPYVDVSARVRKALSLIVGNDYSELEVALLNDDSFWFPLFRGVRNESTISTWTMSRSEHWVSYILHLLDTSTPSDILLIDEPESYLSQPGHRAFLDEIARLTRVRGCQTVIATHSEEMIRRTPPALLRTVTRDDGVSRFSTVTDSETLLRSLRRTPTPVRTIVLVEDVAARAMVTAVLQRFAPTKLPGIDVVIAGGRNEVAAGVRSLGRSERVVVVGVLDGGTEPMKDEGNRLWRLPGSFPERELAAAAYDNLDGVSQRLDVAPEDLRAAVAAARMSEHQRFTDSVANTLGTHTSGAVRDTLARAWATSEHHQTELRSLATLISNAGG